MTALTQDLGSRLLRFPGGLLADYYDWRKAVGPLSSRPVMDTMPGSDPQVAFFGTDEALQFASAVGGELLITVNAGMSKFSGVVQCDTLIANSVAAASYTPGAGNIW